MKRVQFVPFREGQDCSAWTKAPADVAAIADSLGFKRMSDRRFRLGDFSFLRRVLRKLRLEHGFDRFCWKLELADVRRRLGSGGGVLLLQHPLSHSLAFDLRNVDDLDKLRCFGVKLVVVVHDVGVLRGGAQEVGAGGDHEFDRRFFKVADKLIVHNQRMLDWMKDRCRSDCQVVSLGVFDYIVDSDVSIWHGVRSNRVLVAGGFGPGKARYIQDLKTIRGVDWQLYGHDFNEVTMGSENVHYFGKFEASRPPVEVQASWGLVWDGDSIETCAGATGSYLRWNNPHKLSLYLAMGLPVIVWKEAAVSEFVLRNKVGLVVDALPDIPQKIADLSDDQYREFVANAARVAQQLRSGYYTNRALSAVE